MKARQTPGFCNLLVIDGKRLDGIVLVTLDYEVVVVSLHSSIVIKFFIICLDSLQSITLYLYIYIYLSELLSSLVGIEV